ncbi:MAG: hypothetical protein QOJ25_572, partial [Solirubrobacteraceae bacterium]|nr:hypothetical protein [Solirubrobacteraceae bacterium]
AVAFTLRDLFHTFALTIAPAPV